MESCFGPSLTLGHWKVFWRRTGKSGYQIHQWTIGLCRKAVRISWRDCLIGTAKGLGYIKGSMATRFPAPTFYPCSLYQRTVFL